MAVNHAGDPAIIVYLSNSPSMLCDIVSLD